MPSVNTALLSMNITEMLSKTELQRLKRNEYARQYRKRNKSDVIDDASEEKRIALNLKAKFYRDRKKDQKVQEELTIENVPVSMKNLTDIIDSHIPFVVTFIGIILIVFVFTTCPRSTTPLAV